MPIDDRFTEADGHRFYHAAKVIDGDPKGESGSSVRSGAQALQEAGRIANYAFAQTVGEAVLWVATKGPLVVGTRWLRDMFEPDKWGFVRPTGPAEGGHCYVLNGYLAEWESLCFVNSWGPGWNGSGSFYMRVIDWAQLFHVDGEAMTAVELPPK